MVRFVVAPDQIGKALTQAAMTRALAMAASILARLRTMCIAQKSVYIGFVVRGHPLGHELVEAARKFSRFAGS